MEDNFLNDACQFLDKQKAKIGQIDEAAKIALLMMENFQKSLFAFLEEKNTPIGSTVKFTVMDAIQEDVKCEIRTYMDDETINELANKGYTYLEDESTSDAIVLKRNNY